MPRPCRLTALTRSALALPLPLLFLLSSPACTGAEGDATASGSSATTARDAGRLGERLGPSDVTVLWPLREPGSAGDLLGPDAPLGDGKKLLPDSLSARVGQLVEHFTAEESARRLRVVCTRFDPCARTASAGPDRCVGQMRFVLQPLASTGGAVVAQDAAVHLFYEVSEPETARLASELAALPGAPDARPLGAVSARLERDGGEYGPRLRAVISDFGARATLSRVTFMRNVDVKGNAWVFGGFDVDASGRPKDLVVPRVGGSEQRVVSQGSFPFTFSASPAPSGDDTLGLLLDPTRLGILAEANPEGARRRVHAGFEAALGLENPTIHDATTADCASCHVAGSARAVAERAAKDLGMTLPSSRRFPGEPATQPAPSTAADVLRACGYVGGAPTVSRRTKNESAVAAEKMEGLLR